ncbi:MAG TPA: hypothetical protein VGQ40_06325 [Chthoniobacterales bacterium]|nr:hypothetical protein [Chthoniobacterales bacterium]
MSGAVLGFEYLSAPGALALVRARGWSWISDKEHVAIGCRAGGRPRS